MVWLPRAVDAATGPITKAPSQACGMIWQRYVWIWCNGPGAQQLGRIKDMFASPNCQRGASWMAGAPIRSRSYVDTAAWLRNVARERVGTCREMASDHIDRNKTGRLRSASYVDGRERGQWC